MYKWIWTNNNNNNNKEKVGGDGLDPKRSIVGIAGPELPNQDQNCATN